MLLFTILVLLLLALTVVVICAIVAGGTAFIVIFGDVIVCIAFIVLIIRHLIKKRKKWWEGRKASSLFRTLYKSSYENKSLEVCIMFKKIYCMALDSAEDVEPTVKIAVNNGWQYMYKIGVYGDVKQH